MFSGRKSSTHADAASAYRRAGEFHGTRDGPSSQALKSDDQADASRNFHHLCETFDELLSSENDEARVIMCYCPRSSVEDGFWACLRHQDRFVATEETTLNLGLSANLIVTLTHAPSSRFSKHSSIPLTPPLTGFLAQEGIRIISLKRNQHKEATDSRACSNGTAREADHPASEQPYRR